MGSSPHIGISAKIFFFRAGQLLNLMVLTLQKHRLKVFFSFALQLFMSQQSFKEIYANEESRGAGISFESSAVAFYKPINPKFNAATD